jgi:oxaloacetate decarboxylase alpha subunit
MATIEFVDQTIRDGQQSLWGMRLRPGHVLPVADAIDSAGYRVVDLTGSSFFEVHVRFCREDPWQGLDAMRAAMPRSLLRAGTRSNGIVGMGITPNAIIDLWVRTLAKHGIGSLWIYDCLHNLEAMERIADVARAAGMQVSPQVNFSQSPVHTDEYFARVTAAMATWKSIDSVIVGDEAGVLSPCRGDVLLPALRAAAGELPVEMHFHNSTGMGTFNHVTGVQNGMTILHTAVSSMANGPSMPSTEVAVDNMRRLGHDVALDTVQLQEVGEHFRAIAMDEGHRIGTPVEYQIATVEQQFPGGMTGTLIAQLRSYGMQDRLPEVLDEAVQVRAEFGYPVMATPFSQLVGIQALLNVVTGERFKSIPEENLMYLAGHYGQAPGPLDQNLLDRAFSGIRGRKIRDWEVPQPTIEEIRQQYGTSLSDEELLLRYLIPGSDVDAMYADPAAIAPIRATQSSTDARWLRDLIESTSARSLSVCCGDLSATLRR